MDYIQKKKEYKTGLADLAMDLFWLITNFVVGMTIFKPSLFISGMFLTMIIVKIRDGEYII